MPNFNVALISPAINQQTSIARSSPLIVQWRSNAPEDFLVQIIVETIGDSDTAVTSRLGFKL